jgi:hypothetical protein
MSIAMYQLPLRNKLGIINHSNVHSKNLPNESEKKKRLNQLES